MRKKKGFGVALFALAALAAAPAMTAEATMICVNAGNRYQVGDYACLPGCHGRQRYARCDALTDNASWTYISDVCPIALLSRPEPRGVNFAPVETAMTPIPYDIAMSAFDPEIGERIAALKIGATTVASR